MIPVCFGQSCVRFLFVSFAFARMENFVVGVEIYFMEFYGTQQNDKWSERASTLVIYSDCHVALINLLCQVLSLTEFHFLLKQKNTNQEHINLKLRWNLNLAHSFVFFSSAFKTLFIILKGQIFKDDSYHSLHSTALNYIYRSVFLQLWIVCYKVRERNTLVCNARTNCADKM